MRCQFVECCVNYCDVEGCWNVLVCSCVVLVLNGLSEVDACDLRVQSRDVALDGRGCRDWECVDSVAQE